MKKRIWFGIAVISFGLAIFLVTRAGSLYLQKKAAMEQYEQMQQQKEEVVVTEETSSEDITSEDVVSESVLYESETSETVLETQLKESEIVELDIPIDFEALQETNPDIYAWITIPGTEIDYPVVQSSTDNSYYLDHSAERTESVSGAIFSENYNSKDFNDYITILYGHNMRDGTMFRGLHQYEDSGFLQENNEVIIYLPDAILKYEIFAAYLTDDRHIWFYYCQGETEDNRKAYIDDIMDQRTMKASLNTSAEVDADSKILTLSTCHRAGDNYRYLVQAYLVEESR